MERRFDKHYTRDEARALLPQIRSGWSCSTGCGRTWSVTTSA